MALPKRICGQQDCNEYTSRRNHPLCYLHYLAAQSGSIDECPNHRGVYKPREHLKCRQCYEDKSQIYKPTNTISEKRELYSTGGWDKPLVEPRATPLSAEAVSRVRNNMNLYSRECMNNESNTIQYLIDPIVRGLGWDFDNPKEVAREYKPDKKLRVDIALFEEGKPVVFLEAKRLDREYDSAYKDQIDRYASHMEEGTAVLTNGRFWHVSPVRNGMTKEWNVIDIIQGSPEEVAKKLNSVIGKGASRRSNGKSVRPDTIKDKLKDYRLRESKSRNKPAYTIFTNETLNLIASQRPSSLRELESIKGVGPSTLEEHGTAILKIVKG